MHHLQSLLLDGSRSVARCVRNNRLDPRCYGSCHSVLQWLASDAHVRNPVEASAPASTQTAGAADSPGFPSHVVPSAVGQSWTSLRGQQAVSPVLTGTGHHWDAATSQTWAATVPAAPVTARAVGTHSPPTPWQQQASRSAPWHTCSAVAHGSWQQPAHHLLPSSAWRAFNTSSSHSSSSSSPGDKSGRQPKRGLAAGGYKVSDFPPERIRNFCIIAHIDHGKSTLADRLMQQTGAVPVGSRAQYLDRLQVERERGITVKAQTVSLVYRHSDGQDYLLNLIDTPGHVDFSYEVSRSLFACQGALLLVDACQGVQAQTVANFFLAFEQDLALVPVLNKVDLPSADPPAVAAQMASAFDLDPQQVLSVSAKTGLGVNELLPALVERIPPPSGDVAAPLRLLLFDAFHDDYRGVVCLVKVVDGRLAAGDKLQAASTGKQYEALEVGLLAPEPLSTGALLTGQVGYLITGLKDVKAARVGDTWHQARHPVTPLPGFKPIRPMVFAGLYPASSDEYEGLAAALERLCLNDASVGFRKETSAALGAGFRCGFLGPLHLEVFLERLAQEHRAAVISTAPTVTYHLQLAGGEELVLDNMTDYPRDKKVATIQEPTVMATILTPSEHCGAVMQLCTARRGQQLEYAFIGTQPHSVATRHSSGSASTTLSGSSSGSSTSAGSSSSTGGAATASIGDRALLRYQLPLSELAGDFYSKLKSVTHGFASFDYEEGPLRPADLVLLELLVNGTPVDVLARLVPAAAAQRLGRQLVAKLKELLDRQQYEVVLQAAAGGRVVARETLKAVRKDVLAKCYGGDVTRKRKLLEKQKEGKKRMRQLGSLQVPAEVFPQLLQVS